MINENKYYNSIDMPFYKEKIKPKIPKIILDFHTHIWKSSHFKIVPWEQGKKGGKYMVTSTDYSFTALENDAAKIFPDKSYKAVCFGNPTPAVDTVLTNNYVSKGAVSLPGMFPLMIAGKGLLSGEEIEKTLIKGKFLGFKVFLDWWGDDYGNVTIEDMLSPVEMKIAEKYKLIVLLHVPGSNRLANPVIQQGIRKLSENYPNSQIVLAHCGRCYLPDEMKLAAPSIRDLPNVSLDSSMVMDPLHWKFYWIMLIRNVSSLRQISLFLR